MRKSEGGMKDKNSQDHTKANYKLHVISNTHWDREWVYPFQETRLLLLEFMDDLLDLLDGNPEFHSFLLDSQTIAVEDYLDLRPEREEQVKRHVKAGRLIVGPWYSLPEEYIVNGESLVRNLVVGHRLANKWGKVSKIGYTPFSYGQTSQMPQIYRGFDIDTIIFYRGINSPRSEFVMEGPDGSRVTGCRFGALSRFSYYFYIYRMVRYGMSRDEWWYDWDRGALPFRLCNKHHPDAHYYILNPHDKQWNEDVLPEQLKKLVNDESRHFSTSHIACMQGFDTSSPDTDERRLIEACRPVLEKMGHEIFQDSLENFMREMKKELNEPYVIRGESRDPGSTGKWTHLFGDVISSRPRIKRRNALTETALQRWAEPFSTFGWLVGGQYMQSAIDLAWRYLLQNHPHDTICGAGIDQMEKDMIYRFDQATIISQGVMRRGMSAIQKRIDNKDIDVHEAVITVFNPSPYPRSEVVTLFVDLPDKCGYKGFSIRDPDGGIVPYVETERESVGTLVRNLQDISLQQRSQRVTLHTPLKNIPAFGYMTYHLKREKADLGKSALEIGGHNNLPIMENEFLKVEINSDGSLDILEKGTGQTFRNQHYFEDGGESGHPWVHMSPEHDEIITTLGTKASIEHCQTSDFLTCYRVKHILTVPDDLQTDQDNCRRSKTVVNMPIVSTFTLRKGQRWLEVVTELENPAKQHRVRVCFPTGIRAAVSAAEAAFNVIERLIDRPHDSLYYGKPNPQYPMHRFVDISDGKLGLAVINVGIREFEAVDDDQRTLCITLLRGFTAMQSPVIDQWDVYPWMELAQSLGSHQWRYAIMPHAGDWQEGDVYREAEKFNLPLEAAQAGRGKGDLPKQMSFIEIGAKDIVLSALKKCEYRDSIVLRLFNPTLKDIGANIRFFRPVKEAWLTNMNEERREKLPVVENIVSIQFGHKKIVTCEVLLDL
jgi:mannosylglycerate hydrolase